MSERAIKQKILTISELTAVIKELIEGNIGYVWVTGEVSNFSRDSNKGHFYFSLKDEEALIRCCMWDGFARQVKFDVEDGLQIVAFGKIRLWPKWGNYQLYVEILEPKGIGALQLKFEQLKEKLAKEGLFDEKRKRKLPLISKKIAVVTSLDGAAVHDIVTTIIKRFPFVHIYVVPVKVQGEGAAPEIASAIDWINKKLPVDCMIVGRGGGSIEDLWAFNEEAVARAIFESKIPVLSAVGHETDFTISDFVADVRAKTPTHAATLVVPEIEELLIKLKQNEERLDNLIENRLNLLRKTVDGLSASYGLSTPKTLYEKSAKNIQVLSDRLISALGNSVVKAKAQIDLLSQNYLLREPRQILEVYRKKMELLIKSPAFTAPTRQAEKFKAVLPKIEAQLETNLKAIVESDKSRLAGLSGRLENLSPLAVLSRGYSITRYNNKILFDVNKAQVGQTIQTVLHKGTLESEITKIEETLF